MVRHACRHRSGGMDTLPCLGQSFMLPAPGKSPKSRKMEPMIARRAYNDALSNLTGNQ